MDAYLFFADDRSKTAAQRQLVHVESVFWPCADAFQARSDHLAISVVVDRVFHRYFTVSEGRGEILGGGHSKTDRAKAAGLRIAEARRL